MKKLSVSEMFHLKEYCQLSNKSSCTDKRNVILIYHIVHLDGCLEHNLKRQAFFVSIKLMQKPKRIKTDNI